MSPTRARKRRPSVARETPIEAASESAVQSRPGSSCRAASAGPATGSVSAPSQDAGGAGAGSVYLSDPLKLEQMLTA